MTPHRAKTRGHLAPVYNQPTDTTTWIGSVFRVLMILCAVIGMITIVHALILKFTGGTLWPN